MTLLQIVVGLVTLAGMAVAVGLLFAWRIKHDPALPTFDPAAPQRDRFARALDWLAGVSFCTGLCTVVYMALQFRAGAL